MRLGDHRFDSFPQQPGADQLRWYIQRTANGVLRIQEFLADFRAVHEAVEYRGPPVTASPEEARAIWGVLWAVEFCSANITQEANPQTGTFRMKYWRWLSAPCASWTGPPDRKGSQLNAPTRPAYKRNAL